MVCYYALLHIVHSSHSTFDGMQAWWLSLLHTVAICDGRLSLKTNEMMDDTHTLHVFKVNINV